VLLSEGVAKVPLLKAAEAAARGGADALQLRLKETPDREVLNLARALRQLTRDYGVFFVINDRPDIALLVEADAVHVGQEDLPAAAVRRLLPPTVRLGVSTHSLAQAQQAVADGADHIGVGPIYATATRGYREGKGLGLLREVAAKVHVPIIAIGGITAENAREVKTAGASAIAVCRAVLAADDIAAATCRLKHIVAEEAESARENGGAT